MLFIHHLLLSPGSPAGRDTQEVHGFATQELPDGGPDHSSAVSWPARENTPSIPIKATQRIMGKGWGNSLRTSSKAFSLNL